MNALSQACLEYEEGLALEAGLTQRINKDARLIQRINRNTRLIQRTGTHELCSCDHG